MEKSNKWYQTTRLRTPKRVRNGGLASPGWWHARREPPAWDGRMAMLMVWLFFPMTSVKTRLVFFKRLFSPSSSENGAFSPYWRIVKRFQWTTMMLVDWLHLGLWLIRAWVSGDQTIYRNYLIGEWTNIGKLGSSSQILLTYYHSTILNPNINDIINITILTINSFNIGI